VGNEEGEEPRRWGVRVLPELKLGSSQDPDRSRRSCCQKKSLGSLEEDGQDRTGESVHAVVSCSFTTDEDQQKTRLTEYKFLRFKWRSICTVRKRKGYGRVEAVTKRMLLIKLCLGKEGELTLAVQIPDGTACKDYYRIRI
jgi:hypothetical protein